ncbi:unnamed protein product [Rhodiola kirilowii]
MGPADFPAAKIGSGTETEVGFQSEMRIPSGELVKSGKYCHQCRQRTENFMAMCRNTSKKPCPLHYCCRCLMNRYSENADETVALGEWHCPKCRGICNCSVCSRKSGRDEEVAEDFGRIVAESSLQSDEVPRFLIDLNRDLSEDASDDFEITYAPIKASTPTSPGTLCNGISSCNNMQATQVYRTPIETQNENGLGGNYFSSENHVTVPLGIDVNRVASIEMSPEDVGHALQLLEFCKAFGQVFSLNDEDSEILLRDIFDRSNKEANQGPAFIFQTKVASLIEKDREDEEQCDVPSIKINGVIDGEPSSKLRALNFLCDEALNTSFMRNWINTYKRDNEINSYSERKSPCPSTFASKANNDVTQHSESVDPDKSPNKKFKPDAFRSEPKYVNRSGQKFWNFRSSDDMDIYVQDFGEEPMAQDKWFRFSPRQKESVEKYMLSLRSSKKKNSILMDNN